MATPDIGTTISEGYSNGFAKLREFIPALLAPALAIAALTAVDYSVTAQLMGASTTDVSELLERLASGDGLDMSTTDTVIMTLVSAARTVIISLLTLGTLALLTGALRRERLGGSLDLPSTGSSLGAVIGQVSQLMPKAAILPVLLVAGSIVSLLNGVLGFLVSFAGIIALLVLSVSWAYALVVSGSGDAEGDDAFAASETVVVGSWWGTLGVWIVLLLAIGLPLVFVRFVAVGFAGILFGLAGGFLSGLLAASVVSLLVSMVGWVLGAAALESAWAQVAPGDGAPQQGYDPQQQGYAPPVAPPPPPPGTDPQSGPFS